MRRRGFTTLALASTLAPRLTWGQDWKTQVKEFRIGLLGGENTQDRLKRYDAYQKLLQDKLGVPVKMFPAADYAGVMQALPSGNLDAPVFTPSVFAATGWVSHCVNPVVA